MPNTLASHKAIMVGSALFVSALANASSPSNSLPVMYINTDNNTEITSKEYYLTAKYWLDANGIEGITPFGSEEEPLVTEIKARGNYSWRGFDKKPYKLKLADKTALMGMNKHKHFALMARADDNCGFLRDETGFELSRRLGLAWTPEDHPIELVLNGDYKGLYMLTETIKIDKKRVNITEQDDSETDAAKITGGWLVEIDNYDNDPHISITEGDGSPITFTYKSPETLSSEQEAFLTSEMTKINAAIYATDKTSTDLEELVDFDVLARYYLVQEIMDDCESFHGSCYLYRERGDNQKWMFGPCWDFGNSFQRGQKKYIYDEPEFHQTWIGEIAKFPAFQAKVKEVMAEFVNNNYEGLNDYIDNFIDEITTAAASDLERWPNYGNSNLTSKATDVKNRVATNINWLCQQLGIDYTAPVEDTNTYEVYLRGDFNNWGLDNQFTQNSDGQTYSVSGITIPANSGFKVGDSAWSSVDYGSNGDNFVIGESYNLVTRGENIITKEKLENVTFTFDPTNETLIATKPETVTPSLPTIYLRGHFNSWGTSDPFTDMGDGTYKIDKVSFSGSFKVASSDWHTVNFGTNGEKAQINTLYYLVRDTDDNIITDGDFNNVSVTFDYNAGTLLVSDGTSSVVDLAADTDAIKVTGRTITSANTMSVYTSTGALVAQGRGRLTVPAAGLYIIVTPTATIKSLIK